MVVFFFFFFFLNQHHFKLSYLKDDIACEHFEFILFSIVIVLIYFPCITLLAISSKVMVGDISDSCRRKRSIEQIFLGHPHTSGSKSGSGSARCSKNNQGHFYSWKSTSGSLKQMFTTFKNDISDSDFWSVFFGWEGCWINQRPHSHHWEWVVHQRGSSWLWEANDQASRNSASCLFSHGSLEINHSGGFTPWEWANTTNQSMCVVLEKPESWFS